MKVKVNVVTPVFAWSWDTRNELEVKNDIEKKVYPNIINYNRHRFPDSLSPFTGKSHNLHESNNNKQQSNLNDIHDASDDDLNSSESDEDENDVCGICRANYNGTCPTCKIPGDSCPLVIGDCKHFFHYHCIVRWLRTLHSKGLCPMCRRQFLLKTNYPINNPVRKKFNEIMVQLVAKHVDDDEDIGYWIGNQYETPDNIPDNNIDSILQEGDSIRNYLNFYPTIRESPWVNRDGGTNNYDDDDLIKLNNKDEDLLEIIDGTISDKDGKNGDLDYEDFELSKKIAQLYKEEDDRKKNRVRGNVHNSVEFTDSYEIRYGYNYGDEDEIQSDMSHESGYTQ